MRPDMQEALKIRGVTPDQFLSDVMDFERHMLMNSVPQDEKPNGHKSPDREDMYGKNADYSKKTC